MDERDRLAERFDEQRGQLSTVAYRMLGSAGEAEDAVQEAWLRLARTGPAEVGNLPAWLRTELALVNGEVGAIVVTGGRLRIAITFTVEDGKIAEYDVIADPARLRRLSLAILG